MLANLVNTAFGTQVPLGPTFLISRIITKEHQEAVYLTH